MRKFPIKVEKAIKMDYKFIEWKIHNVCNNDCSFCGSRHKDGSQRWFDLETYKKYVDKLVALCNGKPFWFQITGGEPTLFPETIELLKYIKEKGSYISLITNGVRTIRWWEELRDAKVLNALFLTYHSEQTADYQHIAQVANLFHDEPVKVLCLITHTKESLDLGFESYEYFCENTGAVIFMKAMVIGEYDIYSMYSPKQLLKLKNAFSIGKKPNKKPTTVPYELDINHTLKITNNDGSQAITDPQFLMKSQSNKFIGWSCDIGKDNMRVDHDIIYRGVCEVGKEQRLSDEYIYFATDPVICTSAEWYCGSDMISQKTLPKEKYPI